MTYPQNGYPQQPQQPQYQPPQPQFQQPAPQGYAPPPMGYPPNQYPAQQGGYPMQQPQGYGAPQQQQPAPQLAAGSLDQFWAQPSVGGGAALKFEQIGVTHVGIVSRPITDADIQQQTQRGSNLPATFKDGRPKFVMKVPLQVQPSAQYPDGQAQWYVQGASRDELVRAMAAVGAPEGPPEAGALIQVTKTGERPIPGFSPAGVYQVVYQRPQGAQQAPAAAQPPAPVQQPPTPQQAAQPQFQAPQPPVPQQQFQPPAPPPQPQQFQGPQQGAQPPAPAFDPASLPPMSPEQQNLLAGLIGQQQAQPTG